MRSLGNCAASGGRWWPVGVLALLALVGSDRAMPAALERTGCYIGHASDALSPHRVYAIPGGGCVWLSRPDGGFYSIGPAFSTRVGGLADSSALQRDPIGEAEAVCGFSGLFVSWPYFIVSARRVAWGDGTGCHELTGTEAVIWSGHFVLRPRQGRRPAHWEAVVDASSPPLRR